MTAEAKLKVTADTSQADKAIAGLSKGLDGLKKVADLAIAAFLGRRVIGAIGDFIDAAADAQKNLQGVATSLGRMGEQSQSALGEISDFAKGLSALTGVSDDAALQAFNLAASFGATKQQAKDMVTAAVELSAATGKDLDSSIQLLGSSLDGTAGKLATLSPAVRALTADQLKAGEAAKVLMKQFGGAAEAQLNTFGGAIGQTKNAFNELEESLGNIIVQNPVVIAVIKAIGDGLSKLTGFLDKNGSSIRDGLNKGIITTIDAFTKLAGPLKFAVNLFKAYFDASTLAAKGIVLIIREASKFEIVSKAIKVVGIGFLELAKSVIDSAGIINATVEELFKLVGIEPPVGLSQIFSDLSLKVEGLQSSLFQADIPKAMDDAAKAIEDFQVAGDKTFGIIKDGIDSAADSLGDFVKDLLKLPKDVAAPKITPQLEVNTLKEDLEGTFAKVYGGGGPFKGHKDPNNPNSDKNVITAAEISKPFADGLAKGGREGAQAFVGAAAGGVALAFGASPEIGNAIAGIVQFLGQDPDTFKKAIDGFIDGIPDVIDAIIDNIPVFVQALADHSGEIITALAASGPKIAIALAKAMPGVAKALIEEISKGFGYQGAKFKNFLDPIINDFKEALGSFAEYIKVGLPEDMRLAGEALVQSIQTGLEDGLTGVKDGLLSLAEGIRFEGDHFKDVVGNADSKFAESVHAAGDEIKSSLDTFKSETAAAAHQVGDILLAALSDVKGIGGKIAEYFKEKVPDIVGAFTREVGNAASAFYNGIVQAANQFITAVTPGGKGGAASIGGKASNYIKDRVPGRAGGGLIPSGYPKDSFLAGLTSGENVVDINTNKKLNAFLDGGGLGGSSESLLTKMVSLLDAIANREDSVVVQLDKRQLAKAIFGLNQLNEKLA